MKSYKNHLLAGSVAVILLLSFVLSAPRATQGHNSKLAGPTKPVAVVQTSAGRAPVTGSLMARATLGASPVSQAASPNTPEDLSIDASLGDGQIVLKRKHRRVRNVTLVVIQVIAVLISTQSPKDDGGPQEIELSATIAGADAVPGSLLYALAWLAGDRDPLGSVRALGYDIQVSREHDWPCTGELQMCVEHARRLATLLDATLALGSPNERVQFRQGAAALGVPPDCSAREPVPSFAPSSSGVKPMKVESPTFSLPSSDPSKVKLEL